jgi:serine/threonine-protein kinase
VPPITKDTVVDERYRVLARVGSGGMADVYCAEDLQLGRKVALKLLYRRFAEDDEFVERFRREASSAAGLQHPNVVQVYDRGEWDETYYIAMEFVDGRSIKQMVRADGPLDPDHAIDLTIQVLRAERYAHKRGIVHRDIKPQNVLVDEEGRAKVTDFGIARAGASDMTETGSIMGTAQYLSPEQAQGHPVTARSDLYSTGIVLYEMLTGHVPFDGESPVTIALKQVAEAPVPPGELNPRVSPALEATVMRALEKDPAYRYADADEFIAALQAAREGSLPPHLDPSPSQPRGYAAIDRQVAAEELADEDRRNRRMLVIGGLVALAAVAIALGAYLLNRPEQATVPNVVGNQASVAVTRIENAGFEASIETVRNDDVPRDRVAQQRPGPGDEADEGSTVRLVVSSGPGEATIPEVNGLTEKSATRRLERAGFKVETRQRSSDDVAEGRVVSSSPPERSQLTKGRTVLLTISSGPEEVAVPDVQGLAQDEAVAQLEAAGLRYAVTEQETDSEDPGTVLSQSPAAETQAPKGTTITLTVAKEPAKVTVPDVTGESVNRARDELEQAGFNVSIQRENVTDTSQNEKVLSQSPSGGAKRSPDSQVTITVGRIEPTPTPSPSPTPTPAP